MLTVVVLFDSECEIGDLTVLTGDKMAVLSYMYHPDAEMLHVETCPAPLYIAGNFRGVKNS